MSGLRLHEPTEPYQVTKNQIDRLGDRLRQGLSEPDLRLLDAYRRSFLPGYEAVIGTIRSELSLEPTGRPAKSTTSILEKLRRESIRLSQVQDIAGCRLVLSDLAEQDQVIERLTRLFADDNVVLHDRRKTPNNDYRAVHVVIKRQDRLIEVQLRTLLQHLWAELSEKFSDVVDGEIKYGGGPPAIHDALSSGSIAIAEHEEVESALANLQRLASTPGAALTDDQRKEMVAISTSTVERRKAFVEELGRVLARLARLAGPRRRS